MGQACSRRAPGRPDAVSLREARLKALSSSSSTPEMSSATPPKSVASSAIAGQEPAKLQQPTLSKTNSSRTAALALAAKKSSEAAATVREQQYIKARRAMEEFQDQLRNGTLGVDMLQRFAVGVASEPHRRCYVNHDDFSQAFWNEGHPMDCGDFVHDFDFWAFADCQPGTQRIVIGVAGAHITVGMLRCLVDRSSAGDAGWYTPQMAQHGFTPHLSFWAYTSQQPGTTRVAVMASIEGPARSLLLPIGKERNCADVAAHGFQHLFDFWVYHQVGLLCPDTAENTSLSFSSHRGYLAGGSDLAVEKLTVEAARKRCKQLKGCRGFTFHGVDQGLPLEIFFKSEWKFSDHSDWMSYRCLRSGEFHLEDEATDSSLGTENRDYLQIRQTLCIQPKLLERCEVLERAELLKTTWANERPFHELVLSAVRHAFPELLDVHSNTARLKLLHDDGEPEVDIVHQLCKLSENPDRKMLGDWRLSLLSALLQHLSEASEPGDAGATLLLLAYCSWRLFDHGICPVIARRSFDRCLLSLKLDLGASAAETGSDACAEFRDWVSNYIELHKQHAFASAFLEPAKLYWRRVLGSGTTQEADVEAHAANIYACVVERTLGVRCPMPVSWDDGHAVHGVVEFLRAPFLRGALAAMQRLENLGQHFTRLVRKREEADGTASAVPLAGVRFIFAGARSPDEIAKMAVSRTETLSAERSMLLPYLERFASFLQEDFFLEALCNGAVADSTGQGSKLCANALRALLAADPGALPQASIDVAQQDAALCRALLWDFDENCFPCFNASAARQLLRFVGGIIVDDVT